MKPLPNPSSLTQVSSSPAIPPHLKRYIVEQDYSRYTPVDQAVWRHIMKQLTDFLKDTAHPCYLSGLANTGISTEEIPHVDVISRKLEEFGWRAIPVSGFIPPAAFMELQSLGFLPIASDMRSVDHMEYTPAPDIVHEAAGHAPILIEPEFAAYLKAYAQVARKAILSSEDIAHYEAIRLLSDLKEDPSSTAEQVAGAELNLERVSLAMTFVSEAALLGRMNWWTAEYGLIGTLENPKIFGAGLLSSIGEAKACLENRVTKIPLTVDCVNYTYDITEQQPQLFVTPDFAHLEVVLEDLAKTLAYREGGRSSLEKARLAKCVNTVELNSGIQIGGALTNWIEGAANNAKSSSHPNSDLGSGSTAQSLSPALTPVPSPVPPPALSLPIYLQFEGPTQLSENGKEILGQGIEQHAQGFGSPLGLLHGFSKCLSEMSADELDTIGLIKGLTCHLKFESGIELHGVLKNLTRSSTSNRVLIITFEDCRVTMDDQILFDPSWGIYDMAVGSTVSSVFGGPGDREAFGETHDFVAKQIPRKKWSPLMIYKHSLFQNVRDVRSAIAEHGPSPELGDRCEMILEKIEMDFPHEWLLRVELQELSRLLPSAEWAPRLDLELKNLADDAKRIDESH